MDVFTDNRMRQGVFLVLLATLGFATKAIFIKLAYAQGADVVSLMFLRSMYTLPLLLIALWLLPVAPVAIKNRDFALIFALGFLGYYIASLLDLAGLRYIAANLERLIIYLYPTLVLLLSVILLRRKTSLREISSLVVCYSGIVLMFLSRGGDSSNLLLGSILVFTSALCFAVFILASHQMIRLAGAIRFTNIAMFASLVAVLCQYLVVQGAVAPGKAWAVHGYAAMLALFATLLPAYLMAYGIKMIGPRISALVSIVGPVFTFAMAYAFLGEVMSPLQMVGAAAVIIGIYILQRAAAVKTS